MALALLMPTRKRLSKDQQGRAWKRIGRLPNTDKNGDPGKPYLDRDDRPWCARCGIQPTKSRRATYCPDCRKAVTAAAQEKYQEKAPRSRAFVTTAHQRAQDTIRKGTPVAVVTGGLYISTTTLDRIKAAWAPVAASLAEATDSIAQKQGGQLTAEEQQFLIDSFRAMRVANRAIRPLLMLDPRTVHRKKRTKPSGAPPPQPEVDDRASPSP